MNKDVHLLKTMADETRLRILMLLREKELFVCQLMAVTGFSQPLVSRSLALLEREGVAGLSPPGQARFLPPEKRNPHPKPCGHGCTRRTG